MEQVQYHAEAGTTINYACEQAISLANKYQPGVEVTFDFNGTKVIAKATDNPDDLVRKWQKDMDDAREVYLASDEYRDSEIRRKRERDAAESAVMVETAQTEEQMRAAKVPWPLTEKQLREYIDSLVNRSHDYGTCVYAMSMAAEAAFNYVAGKVGSTGFQASCADMDFIRRTRGLKGPFMLTDAENALYPQYDLPARFAENMEKWKPWLKEEATKKLAENHHAHPNVIAHWRALAEV